MPRSPAAAVPAEAAVAVADVAAAAGLDAAVDAAEECTAAQAGEVAGLHPNMARRHLEVLAADGLVTTRSEVASRASAGLPYRIRRV